MTATHWKFTGFIPERRMTPFVREVFLLLAELGTPFWWPGPARGNPLVRGIDADGQTGYFWTLVGTLPEEELPPGQLVEGEPGEETCVGCGRRVAPPPAPDGTRRLIAVDRSRGGDFTVEIEAVFTHGTMEVVGYKRIPPPEVPEALRETVAEVVADEARTRAAVDRARAKGSLIICADCGSERWRDSPCLRCLAATMTEEERRG